jgi:hypothetical protein
MSVRARGARVVGNGPTARACGAARLLLRRLLVGRVDEPAGLVLPQPGIVAAVAHRLSTIAMMDRLVIMDSGRIVEEGTHASLLRDGGHYAGLWQHQSGGFIDVPNQQAAE